MAVNPELTLADLQQDLEALRRMRETCDANLIGTIDEEIKFIESIIMRKLTEQSNSVLSEKPQFLIE